MHCFAFDVNGFASVILWLRLLSSVLFGCYWFNVGALDLHYFINSTLSDLWIGNGGCFCSLLLFYGPFFIAVQHNVRRQGISTVSLS